MHHPTLSTAAVALLAALPAANAGLYPKSSAVLSVDAKNYDNLIAKSNHTSVKLPSYTPSETQTPDAAHGPCTRVRLS